MSESPETLRFLSAGHARRIASQVGTPVYIYGEAPLEEAARAVLAFPNAFGLTARFAMKACPNGNILRFFTNLGLGLDCSSGYEVERALAAGIPAARITLTCQEAPANLPFLLKKGISFNASSPAQIEAFAAAKPRGELGLRINPGLGSGSTNRTNVGGPASSFGIWKDAVDGARQLAQRLALRVVRLHTHIGSGSDPAVWQRVAAMSLDFVDAFPEVTAFDLGGGFKVGRMSGEKTTDLQEVGLPVKEAFEAFARKTGRRLHLEIEPGTWLVANAGALLTTVQDLADTGAQGYRFLKLDAGMTEVLRPSLYGAQHPIVVIPQTHTDATETCVVVGHCCESGDVLTPAPGDSEGLAPRLLARARIGDLCVIEGAGAYCAAMSAKHYNSFPEAPEVFLRKNGRFEVIRKRQPAKELWRHERRVL
ncbi:MAG: diaminopimelate decarboxylase [Spirochaetes bacterium]|nr:diaminopimelate decarboxylase [Spirochaetota bacterium]